MLGIRSTLHLRNEENEAQRNIWQLAYGQLLELHLTITVL